MKTKIVTLKQIQQHPNMSLSPSDYISPDETLDEEQDVSDEETDDE